MTSEFVGLFVHIHTFVKNKVQPMSTILFEDIVFGPVKSRRFGVSLGLNLLPVGYKYCTFNCIYCECGWTYKNNSDRISLPRREEIYRKLETRLQELKTEGIIPDNITYAGNGEPTIHPEFDSIINDTIKLRDKYFPATQITVLSNASLLHKKKVFNALNRIENNVLKLDSAIESTFRLINQPVSNIKLVDIVKNIKKFDGNQIIQTLFLRGKYNSHIIDNTTDDELQEWIKVLRDIHPKYVMIYPIARETPVDSIEKIPENELNEIANRVRANGIDARVFF